MSSKNDYEYGARSCRMDQVRRLSLFSYKSIFLLEVPWSKLPQNQRLRLLSERICPPRRGSRESNSGNFSKIECKVVHAGSSSTSFGQHINAVVNCDNNSKYPWPESDRTKYTVLYHRGPNYRVGFHDSAPLAYEVIDRTATLSTAEPKSDIATPLLKAKQRE